MADRIVDETPRLILKPHRRLVKQANLSHCWRRSSARLPMGDHLWEPICVNAQGNLWLAHSDAQVRTVLLFNDILLVRTSVRSLS